MTGGAASGGFVDPVEEPFVDGTQRHEARLLGMWLFLVNEVMLFGGVFLAIAVYRVLHSEALHEASKKLHLWWGAANTLVLLTSSLMVALAVIAARANRQRLTVWWLMGAAGLGVLFLGIKGYEYSLEYREGLMPGIGPDFPIPERAAELFYNIYLAATGLHALHLTIGILLVLLMAARLGTGRLRLPEHATTIEVTGLYWGLVDVVWVFLYPMLYLVGR